MNLKQIAALSLIVPGLAIQLQNPARAYVPQDNVQALSITAPTFPENEVKSVSQQKQVVKTARALECYLAGGALGECLYWDIFLR